MVMDEGKLIEFDHPAELLQKPDSVFYDLVQKTGMFDELFKRAKSQYQSS